MFFEESNFNKKEFKPSDTYELTAENNDHPYLAPQAEPSIADVFSSEVQHQKTVRNFNARTESLEQAYDKRIKDIETLTGERLENPFTVRGPVSSAYRGAVGEKSFAADFDEKTKKLAEKYPHLSGLIRPPQSINSDQAMIARRAQRNATSTLERYDGTIPGAGNIASFAGSMYGMMSDPGNIGAMLIGPVKAALGIKGIVAAGAKSAAANAGVEIASAPFVADRHKEAGLPYSYAREGALDVATAALFGFGLDAGVRGGFRGVQRARGKVANVDGDNTIIGWRNKGDAPPEPITVPSKVVEDLKNGDVDATRKVVKALGVEDDPEVRATLNELEVHEAAKRAAREEVNLDLDTEENVDKYMQALRTMVDEDEPPPLPPAERDAPEAETRESGGGAQNAEVEDLKQRVRDLESAASRGDGEAEPRFNNLEDAQNYVADSKTPVVEAARMVRDAPELVDDAMPRESTRMRAIEGLTRLSNDAFAAVEAGAAPLRMATLVADHVPDQGRHSDILNRLVEEAPSNVQEARKVIGHAMQTGNHEKVQRTILGGQPSRELDVQANQVIDNLDLNIDDPNVLRGVVDAITTEGTDAHSWMLTASRAIKDGVDPKIAGEAFSSRIQKTLDDEGVGALSRKPEPRRGDEPEANAETATAELRDQVVSDPDDGQILFAVSAHQAAKQLEMPPPIPGSLMTADNLGFYSKAVMAARAIKQAKGTPEQMLSQLKKAGVKQAEIEATGIDEFLKSFGDVEAYKADLKSKGFDTDTVYYHGTNRDFNADAFDMSKVGSNYGMNGGDGVFYFAKKKDLATLVAKQSVDRNGGKPKVLEVYLRDSKQWANDQEVVIDNVENIRPTEIKPQQVTRDGIVAFLELQQVPVREARYEIRQGTAVNDARVADLERRAREAEERGDQSDAVRLWDESERAAMDIKDQSRETKWSSYSLDSSNPTYRETVLHLPVQRSMSLQEFTAAHRERFPAANLSLGELQKMYADGVEIPGAGSLKSDAIDVFKNGHFDEPNAISHLRTSMQPDAEGKQNFVVNELQSDWGQKIRDSGGARDEAKIAALKAEIEQIKARIEALDVWPEGDKLKELQNEVAEKYGYRIRAPQKVQDALDELNRRAQQTRPDRASVDYQNATNDLQLREAELLAQQVAVSGHPLINTTDQWVNTSLRRAVRQAIEDGADYIAIASGETVDSFGMGAPLKGLQYAYNEMYPKKLRDIIKKIDKDAAKPEKVRALKSHDGSQDVGPLQTRSDIVDFEVSEIIPSGARWLVKLKDGRTLNNIFDSKEQAQTFVDGMSTHVGFTRFPITEKLRKAVMGEGQPLFAVGHTAPELRQMASEAGVDSLGPPDATHPVNAHDMPTVQREIDKIVKRLPKEFRVELQENLVFKGNAVDGLIDPYERLIKVSLATNDPVRFARHEEVHAYRQLGLLRDDEWDVLTRYALDNDLRKEYDIDKRYKELYKNRHPDDPQKLEEMLIEETIAEMFADRVGGRSIVGSVNKIIDRIQKFLRNVAESLGYRGYNSIEDVYRRMESGAVGGRSEAPNDMAVRSGADEDPVTPGLDMSQPARLQRARDMGFDTDTVVYHGTFSDFEEFNPKLSGMRYGMDTGRGVVLFHSNRELVGRAYATPNVDKPLGTKFNPRGDARVIPAYLRMKDPLIVDTEYMIQNNRFTSDEFIDDTSNSPNAIATELWDGEGELLVPLARKNGHDGIVIRSEDGHELRIIFDPSNIRSVNAAFDPANADSSRLLASAPRAPDLKRAARTELQAVERMSEVNTVLGACKP